MTCYREMDLKAAETHAMHVASPCHHPEHHACAQCHTPLARCPDLECVFKGAVHVFSGSHFCRIAWHYFNHHRPFTETQ